MKVEAIGTRTKDILGQAFGKWVVIEFAGTNSNKKHAKWLCQCECGNRRIVTGQNLRNGKSTACQSCSVARGKPFEDLTGKTFGKWIVEKFSHKTKLRKMVWQCRCECGFTRLIDGGQLCDKDIGGCRKCKSKKQEVIAWKRYWNTLSSNARKRGLEFSITVNYAADLLKSQDNKCALTGIAIRISDSSKKHIVGETTASLDRIDSQKGYVHGNVQWLHKHVNTMKWDLSQERFIEICRMVVAMHPPHDFGRQNEG